MVEGRQRDQWQHTAEVLAMIANTVRNPKKRRKPFLGRDFYPFRRSGLKGSGTQSTANIKTVIDMYGLRQQSGKKGES